MALTFATIRASIEWFDSQSNTGFKPTTQGPDSLSTNIIAAVATYNRVLAKRYSLAAAGTQVIDLASFTNLLNVATTLTKARGLLVLSNGQPFQLEPNVAANPLPWFFGIAANYVQVAANGFISVDTPATFTTGSKLLLTNQGLSTGTFDVAIIGGT